jgi:hypothetical protein
MPPPLRQLDKILLARGDDSNEVRGFVPFLVTASGNSVAPLTGNGGRNLG